MTDLAEIISALVLLEQQLPWVQRLKGAAGDAAPRPIKETQPATPSLAYPPAQAAKVIGRSHSRVKKAIREKELTARKDGRATLIEHTELRRWISSLPTIGRAPVPELVQKATQVAAKSSAAVQHDQIRARPAPPTRPRSLAMSNALEEALEDNPRR